MKPLHNNHPYNLIRPSFLPDLVEGQVISRFISIPVNNQHSSKWLKIIKVSIVQQSSGRPFVLKLSEHSKEFSIAPGQVRPVILELGYRTELSEKKMECKDIQLILKVVASDSKAQQLVITLRCRKLKESFLFTFLDHDGSVQHAAAISPLRSAVASHCPVLLTLHGTSRLLYVLKIYHLVII